MQDKRGHALCLELIVTSGEYVDIVSFDLDSAVEVQRVVYVRLTRKWLNRRRLQSEAEPDRLISVNAVFVVADPARGVAVKQADAQNQTVVVVCISSIARSGADGCQFWSRSA